MPQLDRTILVYYHVITEAKLRDAKNDLNTQATKGGVGRNR